MKKVKRVKRRRKRNIPKRIRNSLFYLSYYACLVIISLLSFSFSLKKSLATVITDKRLLLILFLLTIIFGYLIYDALTRVYRKYHTRKISRFFTLLIKSITSSFVFGTTALCIIFYVPYLHLSNNYEKTVVASHQRTPLNGIELLRRKGDWQGTRAVAHSLGDMEGRAYVECYETFYQSYSEGFRTFEIDLINTSDGYLVCRHLWKDASIQSGIDENNIPTLERFKATPFYGQYTPISFMDLCQLMRDYPDVWVMVDIKSPYTDTNVSYYEQMLAEARLVDCESIFDRLIVNAYSQEMVQPILDVYPLKNIVFTTYIDWDGNIETFIDDCKWCAANNVDSISMWDYLYNERVQSVADYYGIDVYVHTVDNLDSALYFINSGVRGIYTNVITPDQVGEGE